MEGKKQQQLEILKNKIIENELSEKEMNELLELMNEENEEKIKKWKRLDAAKNLISLVSFSLAIRGKKYQGICDFLKNVKSKITDGVEIYQEVFGGIYMTYDFMKPENFKILLQQIEQTEQYEQNYYQYLNDGKKRINSKVIDYTSQISPEIVKDMEDTKQKIKKLSKQYVNN